MKVFFSSFLGVIAGLFFIFFISILIGVAASSSSTDMEVFENTTLQITLEGVIEDRPNSANQVLLELLDQPQSLSLTDMLITLEAARIDPKIDAIWLKIGLFDAGYASLQELRNALKAFTEEGKTIISSGKIYTQKAYYLASVADEMIIAPQGVMEISGLSSAPIYWKDAFDKLGVKAHLIRGNDNIYKSAGEPFISSEMSSANREQTSARLNSLWSSIESDIFNSIPELSKSSKWDDILNSQPLLPAEKALQYGLIGHALYPDSIKGFLEDLLSYEIKKKQIIGISKYKKSIKEPSGAHKIAVLIAEGEIKDGKGGNDGSITDGNMAEAISAIRKDKRIEAVILRINSPGGSALASDMIWQNISLLAAEKPVYVSMGNVAASGGYYIAAPCKKIYASPMTITGSIGVFGLMFSAEELMHNKLGIKTQQVGTHPLSNLIAIDKGPSKEVLAVLQNNVNHTYDRFKSVVSEGRQIDLSKVDSLAKGHVYSGNDALEIGLIDEFGGLLDVIEDVQSTLDEPARLVFFPTQKDPLQEVINVLKVKSNEIFFSPKSVFLKDLENELQMLQNLDGPQMRLIDFKL
jgi:protease-4|tara:strand:+ start:30859 stop:32598 length:1740 start_codon:yes stop_codon:yes gene_type:complete